MRASVLRNGLTNVHVQNAAAWSRSSQVILSDHRDVAFGHVEESGRRRGHSVPAIDLDTYVEARVRCPVGAVKIDVEGAEVHVLRGMTKVLRRDRPMVMVEGFDPTLQRYGHRLEDLFEVMAECGYEAFSLAGTPVTDAAEGRYELGRQATKNLVFR